MLVRHGTTPSTGSILPGRAAGLHLSERGQAQADAAAQRIAEMSTAPSAVYASPLERTQETAKPIARALHKRVRTAQGLIECDFGDWTGKRLNRLAKLPEWRQVQRAPSLFRFPGGESFPEMATRAYGSVVSLAQTHRGETIVAVSHADPIKAVLATAIGAPLDLFQRLTVAPCSISAMLIGDEGCLVLCMNSTASLADLVPA